MTVSQTTLRAIYTGNGSTTTFAIPGAYPGSPYTLSSDEIQVITRDESVDPPTETVKTLTTHYTISGTNVVFGTAPASGIKVLVWRQLALKNEDFDPSTGGAMSADGV